MKYKINSLNKYFILTLVLLLQTSPSWATDEVDAFKSEVYNDLHSKEFLKLEQLAETLREEQSFFSTSIPKLQVFYEGIQGDLENEMDKVILERMAYIRLLDEWNETIQNSATAKIALADAYVDLAWDYRSSGLRDSITTHGGNKFKSLLAEAWKYLDLAEELNNNDPQLYTVRVWAGMGLNVHKVFQYEAVRHTLLVFPGYRATHKAMQAELLPRWGGDEGEVERFAEWLAAMTEEEYGDQMYALIARSVLSFVGEKTFDRFQFDLSRVREGFKQLYAQFPDLEIDLHYYAWLMVQANDEALAEELFRKIQFSKEYFIKRFWGDQRNFDYWKNVAQGVIKRPKG